MKNKFVKSHGLGNDYLVFDDDDLTFEINSENVKRICDVHYGIGSDGLLLKVPSKNADFGVQMFNPDGSEFEKTGNGLRIFSKYLFDYGFTENKSFTIETKGGIVKSEIVEIVNSKVRMIKIEMGRANFRSTEIPVNIDKTECISEPLRIDNITFIINCVSIGNPHCVIIKDKLDITEIEKYGALIENNRLFPNRINVQFAKPISRTEVEILIWERGVGFTNASGTSACAVAVTLRKLKFVDNHVIIKAPGGNIDIEINDNWEILMTGPVQEIAEGKLSAELIEEMFKF